MPFISSALALTLLAAVTPTVSPKPTPAATVRFDSGTQALSIPIEIAGNGLPFVRGRVHGSPLWFLLDTASPSVLSTRAATQLGLEGEAAPSGSGSGQAAFPVQRLRHVTVRLPGVEVDQAAVSSFDLDPLQTALGHSIDGIFGTPFFESLVVMTDYAGGRLELHDPASFQDAGRGGAMTITRDVAGSPYVHARLKLGGRDWLEGDFLLDTGADSAVLLFSPFVAGNRLLDPKAKTETADGGTAGLNLGAVLRAERLDLGRFTLREPVVELSRSTKGRASDPEHAGLLGGALLSRFRVTWDFVNGRVAMEPNAHYRDPFPYDASGVSLSAQGPDLSTFEIRRVAPGSPAAQANLVSGDVLLAIDGKPVKQITLHGIRKLFQQDGKEYVLSILRDGSIEKIRLKCRRML